MSSLLQRFMNPVVFIAVLWGASWFLSLAMGKPMIDWLKHRKGMKWAPREDTPESHLQKAGTPSMGGIIIVGAAFIGYLSWQMLFIGVGMLQPGVSWGLIFDLLFVLIFPCLVLFYSILGYADDHSKATRRGGFTSKAKLLGQTTLACAFFAALYLLPLSFGLNPWRIISGGFSTTFFSLLLAVLVIVGTSNAVNLTDGIDGLVAGLCVQVALVFGYLNFYFYGGGGRVTEFCAIWFWLCLGGACLGFLNFNKYPAKVFMGDTGSLALGAALGGATILTHTLWLLPFIGFIFFVEMFSVIIQVVYFKITRKISGEGKRVFRRAPLHHHFELGGWTEKRVVGTFWAVNLLTSGIGLALWKMQILPRFPEQYLSVSYLGP
jgi:phospho-N-acetylmuramoyl-pentapeptide-transferase